MGHSNIGTTMDIYGHVTDALQKQAAYVLDYLFEHKIAIPAPRTTISV